MGGRIRDMFLAVIVTVALAFGATEAYAGRVALLGDDCKDCNNLNWNWCAPSVGGADNCDDCCIACGWDGGVCFHMAEIEFQGCKCFDN